MKNLENIAEDLFNKIRGRFPSVTIGDENGQVTNVPEDARYFDFDYKEADRTLGKVSISIDENSLSVMYSDNFVATENTVTQNNWYDFLKELRQFSKKRMLNFDTRNITKSNLDKRDYNFLATNRLGEEQMNESQMYGTNKTSFQKIGNAKLSIKHSQIINTESSLARSQKIGKIFIESPEGEKFKYPYKHLSGARAMARHVAEGGTPYDDFGKHIVGLSEELSKLRKFNSYMKRSAVMAESLAGYLDVVKERANSIKKEIANLQKENFYKEAVGSYEAPVLEDVPADVAENWIDQLTIKQFNEELQDVFPYIYNLVSEATKAAELGPDQLEEGIVDWIKSQWQDFQQARADRRAQYDQQLQMMTQIMQDNGMDDFAIRRIIDGCLNDPRVCMYNHIRKSGFGHKFHNELQDVYQELKSGFTTRSGTTDEAITDEGQGNLDNIQGPAETVKVRQGMTIFSIAQMFNDQNNMGGDVQEFVKEIMKMNKISNPQQLQVGQVLRIPYSMGTGPDGASRGLPPGGFTNYESQIEDAFEEMMGQFSESNDCDSTCPKSCPDCGGTGDPAKYKEMKKDEAEVVADNPKTPLGEFILSYFDYTTGQFPKGETAVLTMVEKDYGEKFIEPAKQFIERINNKVAEVMGYRETETDESALMGHIGKKKYGKDGMAALSKAGREGASEEELGRIKDQYKRESDDLKRLAGL